MLIPDALRGWVSDLDNCPPLYSTPRNPTRQNRLVEARQVARRLGWSSLMPAQEHIIAVGSEIDPATGDPWYREIVITLPRQCGKTAIIFVWVLDRLLRWPRLPQRAAWGAQTLNDATAVWDESLWPLLLSAKMDKPPVSARFRTGVNRPGLSFGKGSALRILSTGPDAGRGGTYGLVIIDEAMAAKSDDRYAAVLPTMRTVADAQILVAGTAGTAESTFLRGHVEAGRASVDNAVESGTAYFEWSAPDDCDWEDPAEWARCTPGLGHTIPWAALVQEYETAVARMREGTFRREALNQWVDHAVEPAIPWAVLEAVCYADARVSGRVAVAVDAPPERNWCTVAVSDGRVVEVWRRRPGVGGWVSEALEALATQYDVERVVYIGTGAAATVVERLTRSGSGFQPPAESVAWSQVAKASGRFEDDVFSGEIMIKPAQVLFEALASACRAKYGEGLWRWGRAVDDADISPLLAVSLAWDGAQRMGEPVGVDRPTVAALTIDDDEMAEEARVLAEWYEQQRQERSG